MMKTKRIDDRVRVDQAGTRLVGRFQFGQMIYAYVSDGSGYIKDRPAG